MQKEKITRPKDEENKVNHDSRERADKSEREKDRGTYYYTP